ncbi:MAG: hypothetical protein CSB01_03650, partial [Bacteroidia bacterium]
MIEFVKRKHIDTKKWDALLYKSDNRMVYALSGYLDLMSDCRWNALIEKDKNGEYKTVMPLPFKEKYGVKYLYQPFFSQQLGVFSKGKITSQMTLRFIEAIPKSYRLVEINLNEGQKIKKEQLIGKKI